jgi:hypothetical protein
VFGVYPWLGMLRAGNEGAPLTVLDRCRIRWGTVVSTSGEELEVRSRALVMEGSQLVLGQARVETVRQSSDGIGLLSGLSAGDVVSLHWDWVCDRLTPNSLHRLIHCTKRTLNAVNTLAAPGPAVACDLLGS